MENQSKNTTDEKLYFDNYSNYNSILRTWFVTFSISALYFLFTNNEIICKMICVEINRKIEFSLVTAIFLQVIIAIINKYSAWCYYKSESDPEFKERKLFSVAEWFSEMIYIDIVIDLITIGLYLYVFIILMRYFG